MNIFGFILILSISLTFFLFLFFSRNFSFNHLFSSRRRDSCEDAEYERSSFNSKVSTILLRFRNKKWEMSFLREQDLMLKYSTFMCFIVFIGIIVVQALNNPWAISEFTPSLVAHHSLFSTALQCFFSSCSSFFFSEFHWFCCCCFSLFLSFVFCCFCCCCANVKYNSDGWSYWVLNATSFSVLLFFLSITWFKKIWILLRPINGDDPNLIELPTNPFLRYLSNTSKSVMNNAVARMLIYFVSVCVLTLSALIHLVRNNAHKAFIYMVFLCFFYYIWFFLSFFLYLLLFAIHLADWMRGNLWNRGRRWWRRSQPT